MVSGCLHNSIVEIKRIKGVHSAQKYLGWGHGKSGRVLQLEIWKN